MFLLFQRGIFSGLNQLCLELLHKSPHRWIQHCLPAVGFSHLPQHHGHIFHIALNLKLMLYETCDGKNVSKQIWYLKRKGCQTVWGKNVWGLTPQLHILHKLSRSRLQNIGVVAWIWQKYYRHCLFQLSTNFDVFSKPFHGFFSSQSPANQHHHCIRVLTNTASRLRAFSCSPWSPLNRTSQADDLAREDLRSETPKYHCVLLLMYETFPEFSNPPQKNGVFFWIDAILF